MTLRRFGLCLVLLPVAALPASAQTYATDRGSLLLGGTASFTSTGTSVDGEDDDDRLTQISIAPTVRYFVVPGLALGGSVSFGRLSSGGDDLTSWGLGPAASYYFGSGERSMYPYLSAEAAFAWTSGGTNSDDRTLRSYAGAAGLLFMLSGAVGVNAELFYRLTEFEDDAFGGQTFDLETDTFGLAIGFTAFVF